MENNLEEQSESKTLPEEEHTETGEAVSVPEKPLAAVSTLIIGAGHSGNLQSGSQEFFTESKMQQDQADREEVEIQEPCDEIVKSLVANSSKIRAGARSHEQIDHDPECDLSQLPPGYQFNKYDPNRPYCTCGVCPLDGKTGSKGQIGMGIGDDGRFGDTGSRFGYGGLLYGTAEYFARFGRGQWGMGEQGSGEGYGQGQEYAAYTPLSDRSRYEGSYVEDYMKFMIEPIEPVCYKSLSSFSSSYVSCEDTGLQRTIVIVKPQAVKFKEAIYRLIFEAGFQILGVRILHLTPEQVSEIYAKFYGSPSFVHLVVTVSEAPVLAICISALNVVNRWLSYIGTDGSLRAEWFYPLSMRKLFGLQDTQADWIHGSENIKEANKESRYFYPEPIIEPIIQEEEKVWDYCNLNLNKSIVEACTEVVKKRPADPIIFFADYLLLHNPFQPRLPKDIALTPT